MKLDELENKLISGLFTFQELRKGGNKMMEITYRNSVYYGQIHELEDGRCHKEGKGVLLYDSGRVYEGNWKNNKREGLGFEKFENSNIYQGEFMMGKAHGRGVYVWENGETYDGEWYKGMRQGKGAWKGISGESYEGEWRRGKAHGFGTHVWSNSDRYEGEWYRSLKHGRGKDHFHTGDSYEGEYRYGKFEGTGKFKWSKGMIYKGQFKQGMRHGKGQWMENENGSGASYSGEYYRDKKHGIGIYKWPSGSEYRGNYVNDKREGYGEMYWSDGTVFKGEWKDGACDPKTMQKSGQNNQQTMHRSVYSHMPRQTLTAMEDRNMSYMDNQATQKRRYSNTDKLAYHDHSSSLHRKELVYRSPEQNSSKFNIELLNEARDNQLSYTAPYKKRVKSHFQHHTIDANGSFLPKIQSHEKFNKSYEVHKNREYESDEEGYETDNYEPRKPRMREDRSTSPPDHDPLFRRAHQKSIGIQESNSQELLPKVHKKKSRSRSNKKRSTPQKMKFTNRFIKKYPSLFKGVKKAGSSKRHKPSKVLTVVYKPWIPASRKYDYFDEMARNYKVY